MRALARRLRNLERERFDATGFEPYSKDWYEFYEDKLVRLLDGEDIGNIRIPLAVIDRRIAEADAELEAAAERTKSGATAPSVPASC